MVPAMLTQNGVVIGIALAIVATTAVFLVALAGAAIRRWRGGWIGRTYGRLLSLLAGGMFGTMFLVGGELPNLVLAGFVLWLAAGAWRRGRRTDAGLIVVGAALPGTMLWALYAWATFTGQNDFDPQAVWTGLAVGAVPLAIGLGITALGDRLPAAARQDSRRWQPGARTIGTLATAVRGSSSMIGSQEIAAVVALVVALVVGDLLLLALGVDRTYGWVVSAVLASIAASEAYIRVIPPFNRRAFEALSWLGEQELARVKAETGQGVPLSRGAAAAWLDRHGPRTDIDWIKAQVLVLAGRNAEARAAAERMPDTTPFERLEKLSTLELVDWIDGRGGNTEGLRRAAAGLPADSEEGLQAAVMVAVAETRLRMSDGRTEPGDAARPLVDVRERLGHRADGQVGRALRPRILPLFLALSLGFGLLLVVGGGLGLPGIT
jgi:hypothetical protein